MEQSHYDLIVIGAGSGGLAVAEIAAQLNKRVAIVEASKIGGTCVNNGCVPKKIMWYAAKLSHDVEDAKSFGIPSWRDKTDWPLLVTNRDNYIKGINEYWKHYVSDNGIEYISGTASFIDAKTISVNHRPYTADHIVISTGSQPMIPDLPGTDIGITSDDFFKLREQPRNVAVIGGGYIGVEISGVLNALGSSVSLFVMDNRLLPQFDPFISIALKQEMQAQGIQIKTRFKVSAVSRSAEGILLRSTAKHVYAGFDTVVWAIGRKPNTHSLNLAAAGINVQQNGTIPVDEYENTNVAGIYAIGDVTGKMALTPVAIAAGRKLAQRLFNGQSSSKLDYKNIPSVVFTHPPIGTMGMTEQQARRQFGHSVTTYTSEFTPMRYAFSSQKPVTAMKLVCTGNEQKIVGLHIIGDNADEILQGFAVAIKMGATKEDFDNTIAIHPTSAEELVTMKIPDKDSSTIDKLQDNGLEWREATGK